MRHIVRTVGCFCLIVSAAWLSAARANAQTNSNHKETTRPNVIIIYGDDVGYGDVGAYGAEKIDTPHIDQMAEHGVRFTSAYATASTCTPSRYSLLTGRYAFRKPSATILPASAPLVIDTDRPTLASVFAKAGYTTGMIGKWHLGLGNGKVNWNKQIEPGPKEIGFDRSFIMPATNDRVPTVYVDGYHVAGLNEDDPPLRISYKQKIGDLPTGKSHPAKLRYPADDQHSGTIVDGISRIGWMAGGQSAWWEEGEIAPTFVKQARRFMREQQDDPFLLYMSLRDVHVPRWPMERFRGESESGLRGDAMEEADWVVGQMVQTLRELNVEKETIVIFTSDNGPVYDDGYGDGAIEDANGHEANGPFRGGKYLSFEGGTRMPTVVYAPGRAEAGVTSDAIISQVDLLASLAALCEVDLPKDAAEDSIAMPKVLLGKTQHGRGHVVQQGVSKLALRRGQWKYIPAGSYVDWVFPKHNEPKSPIATPQPPRDRAMLFNLEQDPGETNNLIDQRPDIARSMRRQLERIKNPPLPPQTAAPDEGK
jgi:arylsulfatase A-like enzyme